MASESRRFVAILIVAISLIAAGCNGGDSSNTGTTTTPSTGPQIASATFVDVDGNGVDVSDVVVVEFSTAVEVRNDNASAFDFTSDLDTLGVGAVVRQSVPGSTRVEIELGTAADFIAGTSAMNIIAAGSSAIVDLDGEPARIVGTDVTVTDATSTAPTLIDSTYADSDQSGTVNAGDTILVEYDKPVSVPSTAAVANNFTTPVTSDTFGGAATLAAFASDSTNRGVLITLGTSPTLTVTGTFASGSTTAGSPSAVESLAGGVDADEINDTLTAGANRPTAAAQVDLDLVTSRIFGSSAQGDLFVGTSDSASPNVGSNTLLTPGGSFHYNGNVTVGSNTFAVDLFFVADTGNNRVLVYETKPTGNNTDATVVLGQANFAGNMPNRSDATLPSPTASTMWAPEDVHFHAATNQLVVSDTSNNRVLIWNAVVDGTTGEINLTNGDAADVVVGQNGTTGRLANQGASVPTSRTLSGPTGIHAAGGQLAIADTGNNRVLIFGTVPTANAEAATTVLGQADFVSQTANNGGISAATLSGPEDVCIDPNLTINSVDGGVVVADTGNNRVLIWHTGSPATGSTADVVLGQSNATNNTADEGGISAARMDGPTGVFATDFGGATAGYWVCDRDNHRLLYFSHATNTVLATGATGTEVGQANATNEGENRTEASATAAANSFAFPARVTVTGSAGTNFFVADRQNHRILDFTTVPVADASANVVQGQSSFVVSRANGQLMHEPTGFDFEAGQLFVADTLNHRVLIFDAVPTSGSTAPDTIVGQSNVNQTLENSGATAPTAASMAFPSDVLTDGTRFFVSDTENHRILVFNTIPAADGASADLALGQADLVSGLGNRGGAVASNTLRAPAGMALSGTDLIVCDQENNRVLIFDDVTSLATGQAADVVIGQDDFTSNQPNQGFGTALSDTLNQPAGVAVIGGVLYIVDQGNNRVLVYNSVPTSSGQSANGVIGQATFLANESGTGFGRLNAPSKVFSDGTRFVIADTGNNRVQFFESVPGGTTNAFSAIGQGLSSTSANRGAIVPGANTLFSPTDVLFDGRDLWIVDSENSRVVRYR